MAASMRIIRLKSKELNLLYKSFRSLSTSRALEEKEVKYLHCQKHNILNLKPRGKTSIIHKYV